MTDITKIGKDAQQLLDSEAFRNVMAVLKDDAFKQWTATQPEHGQAREDLYYFYVALSKIEIKLRSLSICANNDAKIKAEAGNRAKPI